jgi:hypothetical protein
MADNLTSLLSGGLIDTSAPKYGSIARKSEKKRQGIINLGLDQINAIYQGGDAPFYSGTSGKFDPHSTYYNISGKTGEFQPYWAPGGAHPNGTFTPGMGTHVLTSSPGWAVGFGGNVFGNKKSPKQIARSAFNSGQLFGAPETKSFEGFQEPFYEKRAQDYVNFALPQLSQQYQQSRNAMLFGLANRGLGQSSVANQASSNLERQVGQGRQEIADTGIAQANQLRKDVEGARQQAISQLYQSADPAQALQGAVRNAMNFQAPSTFAPISNMFTGLAQQYATNQILNNYRQPYGAPGYDQGNYLAPIPS